MFAKPEPRERQKRRAKRHEAAVIHAVRAEVVARDGFCRAQGIGMGACIGHSEWCHFGNHKRFKTRGRAPEERHQKSWSLMLCSGHHYEYDHGDLHIEALTPRACDGPLRFERDGAAHDEETAA